VDFTVHALPVDSVPCPGRFLGIIGGDPTVSKTNRLDVAIFRVFIIRNDSLRNIGVYFVTYSKWIGNLNRLFLKPNWFICK